MNLTVSNCGPKKNVPNFGAIRVPLNSTNTKPLVYSKIKEFDKRGLVQNGISKQGLKVKYIMTKQKSEEEQRTIRLLNNLGGARITSLRTKKANKEISLYHKLTKLLSSSLPKNKFFNEYNKLFPGVDFVDHSCQ